ncbi:MAG: DNA recombination protein RmuC [Lachnospiraceae bacterium]|nr:DNA recombination protein RmuC [Lachnospiraceae bacterium]
MDYLFIVLVAIVVMLLFVIVFTIIIFARISKKQADTKDIFSIISKMEKNVIQDANDNFVKILNQNQSNSNNISKVMQESLEKISTTNENKLNELRKANEEKLGLIERNINDKLDKSLNERLDSSFKNIGEQLQNLQVTNGQLLSMSGTIADLQKSLSSVKARGVFGEKQLENILESIMTSNMYEKQFKIKKSSDEKVDFAIKIPNKDDDGFVYLPIDAKFPNDRYMDVVNAANSRDEGRLNAAIKSLKDAIVFQAKSISEKYIEPPLTTEFAIMFLPTEGLYAECLRIDGLADDCQRDYKILLAGPTTITALINSFSIGFKFLQVNKNSKEIAKILQAIKVQYNRFGEEIDKTKKSLEKATESTDQLAKRNQMITNKLKSFDSIGVSESDAVLGLDDLQNP